MAEAILRSTAKLPKKRAATIRREAAIEAGDKHYLGAPCCYGHEGWRFVTNYQCVDCLKQPDFKEKKRIYDVAYRATLPPGQITQRARDWQKKNPEKRKTILAAYTARRRQRKAGGDSTAAIH